MMPHSAPRDARRVTLKIDGMSCGHCVTAVAAALAEVPGVAVDQVSIGSATLSLDSSTAAPGTLTDAALEAVREAGYEPRLGDGDDPVPISRAPGGTRR